MQLVFVDPAVGVFAMVVTLALMTGFREEIQATLFSATAHFTVFHLAGDIPDTQGTLKSIRAVPGVQAASPIRMEKGLLRRADSEMPPEAVVVKAVDPATAHGTSSIFDSIQPLPIEQLQEGEIVLGRNWPSAWRACGWATRWPWPSSAWNWVSGPAAEGAAFRVPASSTATSRSMTRPWPIHLGDAMPGSPRRRAAPR
ncbi:MAG: hypothetical protein IPN91_15870 [Holophagaceae bacterium]|uniref:Uncharacterized protein n=1 Tax=Candidatus Geothrix odensensis TaxID=2954440 RepID=A0A936K906_9BACT|nr:hypothetical protein [Candidatus Geothrix odensensis]